MLGEKAKDPLPTKQGENLVDSWHGVSTSPPMGWEAMLRGVSEINEKFSHLRYYWYRAKMRWILYDCVPRSLIKDNDLQGSPITGRELISLLEGKPPREYPEDSDRSQYVSDVQHEFYRLFRVYARPFWVLQGDSGGHQVKFSPWQQNVLLAKHLPSEPPIIGSLAACPFDNRVIQKLQHLNRLHRLDDKLEKLQESSSAEYADAEMARVQKEIRLAETEFIESQVTPLVDMSSTLAKKSDYTESLIHVPGQASRTKDAYQAYLETGEFAL